MTSVNEYGDHFLKMKIEWYGEAKKIPKFKNKILEIL